MTRPPLLIPALAIAILLTAAPVAASQTANSKAQPAVYVEFDLEANHGLRAHVGTFNEVNLEIEGKGRLVTYEVQGEITEAGLKAQFGSLGVIDVAFKPTKTFTSKPPKGCNGKPSTFSEGLFVGTIKFTGEREYVRIETSQVKGTMSVSRESEWHCPGGAVRLYGASHLSAFSSRVRANTEREPATLTASNRRCRCFFAAFAVRSQKGRGPSLFYGAKFENREGMEISRVTFAKAGASAFVFDHGAGTARVHPPQPFSGNGTFKRRLHRGDLWRSTIQVPLLGTDPLSFRWPQFPGQTCPRHPRRLTGLVRLSSRACRISRGIGNASSRLTQACISLSSL